MSAESKTLAGAKKTDKGVEVNGFLCHTVVEKCEGCDRVREFEGQSFCASYPQPERKWSLGRCNFATHVKEAQAAGAKVNPLKASKRSTASKRK
ncbi:PxxKW family cysteine-rich protein [Desulfovibrio litoralis]|uniref:Uncharacterized protein n=1 Tax=Desulfovibrio litoralis DSM 11393 TaxID=1121455 RepID=A0A1M7SX70_9BACT|nr:PxxKW family cysteine-rich protein [Desulfovibrio litoralis]SHN62974.1 hypothetical protein SAMN02745728_01322 [Desulfovibrio litoralis DSM 11393]